MGKTNLMENRREKSKQENEAHLRPILYKRKQYRFLTRAKKKLVKGKWYHEQHSSCKKWQEKKICFKGKADDFLFLFFTLPLHLSYSPISWRCCCCWCDDGNVTHALFWYMWSSSCPTKTFFYINTCLHSTAIRKKWWCYDTVHGSCLMTFSGKKGKM